MGPRIQMERPGVDGNSGPARFVASADFGLRSSPGFLDAGSRGEQPAAHLSGNRAAPGRLCEADELHPRGTAPHHGTSVLRFVGLPDHGIFRTYLALWHTPGLH